MPVTLNNLPPRAVMFEPVTIATTIAQILPSVGEILRVFGIRSGTVHPNSTQANEIANAAADKIWGAVQSAVPSSKLQAVADAYRAKLLEYIPRIERWRNQDSWAPRSVPIQQIRDFYPPNDPKYVVRNDTFWLFVWLARNSDAQRPMDFVNVAMEDMRATLIPVVNQVTGSTIDPGVIGGGGGGEAPGAGTTVGTANFAGTEKIVLAAAVIGVVWAVWKRGN